MSDLGVRAGERFAALVRRVPVPGRHTTRPV
jgi:hypothetical protein